MRLSYFFNIDVDFVAERTACFLYLNPQAAGGLSGEMKEKARPLTDKLNALEEKIAREIAITVLDKINE